MLDHEDIRSCLEQAGYDAALTASGSRLTLTFDVGERHVALVHDFPDLLRIPVFWLASGYDGKLGHVGAERNGGLREVCIRDPGSTAINTDRPELVYHETVRQHVETLTRLIQDPEYNRVEQLREFDAHWQILCRQKAGPINELFVVWDGQTPTGLQVRPPGSSTNSHPLRRRVIALAEKLATQEQSASVRAVAEWNARRSVGTGVGVRLSGLEPAPASRDELSPWYFRAVSQVNVASHRKLRRLRKKRSRDHWVIFSAPIPDGEAMFAVRWRVRLTRSLAGVQSAGGGRWVDGDTLPSEVAVTGIVGASGRRFAGPKPEVRAAGRLWLGRKRARTPADISWGRRVDNLRSRGVLGGQPLSPCPFHKGPRPVEEPSSRARNSPEASLGESNTSGQTTGNPTGSESTATIRSGGSRDRFADSRTDLRGILPQESPGRTGDELLARGPRNRRPCDPGDAEDKGVLALRLRGPQDAQARPHVEPEFPETGTGGDAQTGWLWHAIPPVQRYRGELHGGDGREPSHTFSGR